MGLKDLLDKPDNDYEVTIGGETLVVGVKKPGHMEALRANRDRYAFLQASKARREEAGEDEMVLPYDEDEIAPITEVIDEHIITVGDERWEDLDDDVRKRFIQRLDTKEFWGVFDAIVESAEPDGEEKKDSESS